MSPKRPLSGMVVRLPEEARRLGEITAQLESKLYAEGFVKMDVPIIEPVEPFLLRSGEGMRQWMYAFKDPLGREVCLRPEMTIPVVRAFLSHMSSEPRPAKLFYDGPVFRHRPEHDDGPKQERQIGAEIIGSNDALDADVEIASMAFKMAREIFSDPVRTAVGDFAVYAALIDGLDLDETGKCKLLDLAGNPAALTRLLSGGDEALENAEAALDLAPAKLSRDQGIELVRRIVSQMPYPQIGVRSIDEIAERFWDRLCTSGSGAIGGDASDALAELMEIRGPWDEALPRLRELAGEAGDGFKSAVDRLGEFVGRLVDAGVPSGSIELDFGLSRAFAYYSGLVFDTIAGTRVVGGGGRYDGLISMIDPAVELDAVGFALSLDALLEPETNRGDA